MNTSTDPLLSQTEAFAADWAGALGFAQAQRVVPDAGVDVAGMSDAGLLQAARSGFAARRQEDALLTRIAGEIEERSRSSLGADGLAKRTGSNNAALLLAELGRITVAEASRLCRVGEATASPVSLLGERMPVRYPAVAAALAAGAIPVDSAEAILSNLNQARANAHPEDLVVAEEGLVAFATENAPDLVRKLAIRTRDRLDTDGIEPREEQLIAKRGLSRINRRDGMVRYIFDADPLSAGLVDAWVQAQVGAELRKQRVEMKESPGASGDPHADPHAGADPDGCHDNHELLADGRSTAQMAADAMVDLLRHGLSCTAGPGTGVPTTMIVRIDLDNLMTGLGEAQIDGIEQPISAGAARRLAADAHIIPMVLGGNSEVLDFGLGRRLFSKAQRLALAERDDGCASPGCTNPATYTEAHHILWWESQSGPTDLLNGILLCSPHHHMLHRNGWGIRVTDNVPWFIPPPSVDINQTPRRGGRLPAIALPGGNR